jgi:glutamate-1-semialdehyde 2,1-aminomutase
LNLVEETLHTHPEIGSVILEPTGGHWGAVPIRAEFLQGLREITSRRGIVLIFDEVITGFRVAPGGAQTVYGVTPDLTTLAKILAGGLPGGCLAGKAEILAYLEPRPGKPKMKHPGTYNANPLSASAGIATLQRVATGEPSDRANRIARQLRNRLNAMFAQRDYPWVAYGDFSMIRVVLDRSGFRPKPETADFGGEIPHGNSVNALDGAKEPRVLHALRQGMLLHGVDWWGNGGMTSCEHSDEDVTRTVQAMEQTLGMMRAEGLW